MTGDHDHDHANHYYDPSDRKYSAKLRKEAEVEFSAFRTFNAIVARDDGAIPRKYRELIAVAVALNTQCVYCIEAHVVAAKDAGATGQELAETVFLAAALRAGGSVAHGRLVMKFFEHSTRETLNNA